MGPFEGGKWKFFGGKNTRSKRRRKRSRGRNRLELEEFYIFQIPNNENCSSITLEKIKKGDFAGVFATHSEATSTRSFAEKKKKGECLCGEW
jgi:hypothetical protein